MGSTLIDSFGDLRALVQRPASRALWKQLCAVLEHWPDHRERDEHIIPYLAGALRHWPDEWLVAPEHWVQRFLNGQSTPYLYIARHLLIHGLWLDRARARRLTHAAQLTHIRVLTIHGARQEPQLLAALLNESSWIPTLHTLRLHHNAIGLQREDLCEALEHLERLTHLELHHMSFDADAAQALLGTTLMGRLHTLDLSDNPLEPHALDALEDLALPGLRTLGLSSTRQGPEVGVALGRARDLSGLKSLKLAHNVVGEVGMRGLLDGDATEGLEALHLAYSHQSDESIMLLTQSQKVGALRELSLYGNKLTSRGAIALARARHLHTLETLRLELNDISAPGWLALSTSEVLSAELKARFEAHLD
jgi:hypothetical protein